MQSRPIAGAPAAGLPRAALLLALAALAVELLLAWSTHGTNDVDSYREFMDERVRWGATGVYERDPFFNHPPFMLHALLALSWFVKASGLPFAFCFRLPAILAGFVNVWLVAQLVAPELESRAARLTLACVALAPATLMIAGFHGNTDPVMLCFVLLALYCIERPKLLWLAGAALGMSINIKIVPLILLPAVFMWLEGWRARVAFFGALALVVGVGSLPMIVTVPKIVVHQVLGYPSDVGVWGLSWILLRLRNELPWANMFFMNLGRPLVMLGLAALSVWMNWGERKPSLFRQVGLLWFAFLAFAPAFGVQYLAWIVPWIAGVPLAAALAFTLASGAYLFMVYTCWCNPQAEGALPPSFVSAQFWRRGLPWDAAGANIYALYLVPLALFGLACWASVVCLFLVQLRAIARQRARARNPARKPGRLA